MGERRKPPSFKGKQHSESAKRSMSSSRIGKPMKEFSDQAIENMRRGAQRRWQRVREQRNANNQDT